MNCKRCASDVQKVFNGELAIHFPGMEGIDKPVVWVFPKLLVCLRCGFAEFLVPDEQVAQLKNGDRPAQSHRRVWVS
jgi:hypothetical protein